MSIGVKMREEEGVVFEVQWVEVEMEKCWREVPVSQTGKANHSMNSVEFY